MSASDTRDGFSKPVKESLAKRAGFRCCFPSCAVKTIGPSSENENATSSSGDAAHIVAASGGPGARRVRAISSGERRSSSNGIWMCTRHARIIDRDEQRFTIPMLGSWKKLAEYRARLEHETGKVVELDQSNTLEFTLVENAVEITKRDDCSDITGRAFDDSCARQIWGRAVADAVRDSVIELAFNSFMHGGAKTVQVVFSPRAIAILDDGQPFDPALLPTRSRFGGGTATLAHLAEKFSQSLFQSYKRESEQNVVTFSFIRTADDVRASTACHYELAVGKLEVSDFATCDHVFFILPRYMVHSQSLGARRAIQELQAVGKKVILVITDVSDFVKERIRSEHPDLRIIFASVEAADDEF